MRVSSFHMSASSCLKGKITPSYKVVSPHVRLSAAPFNFTNEQGQYFINDARFEYTHTYTADENMYLNARPR